MNKLEFMIRLIQIKGQKLRKFKTILMPFFATHFEREIDLQFLLSLLNLTPEQKQEFNHALVDPVLDWLSHPNHHFILYSDDAYPDLLRQISAAPLALFVIGDLSCLKTPQIAMVGSRQLSHYGAYWARYFAHQLSLNGLTITSGLALGIDALSHRGALDSSKKTIAVLGSGLNQISPKSHFPLAFEIIQNGGALVSEFLPNEVAKPEYFPRRNRIISGLSLGTFIVEASEKSGSLITARYALEQNRDVFALPSEIHQTQKSGTNELIKQGAYLVSEPEDILSHYSNALKWIQKSHHDNEIKQVNVIHPDVFLLINQTPICADKIAEMLNMPITEMSIKLVELELEGLIRTVNGGYIRS